jgi:hypothetical protein
MFLPAPTRVYVNDSPWTPGVYLGFFADDTCIWATDSKESHVLRKLQRDLSITETWCERCNIKLKEEKTWTPYISHWLRPPEAHLTLTGRNTPFVNHAKYLGAIFDNRITWRLHIEMIEVKVFWILISVYSLPESERLSADIKLTLHKVLIRSVIAWFPPPGN